MISSMAAQRTPAALLQLSCNVLSLQLLMKTTSFQSPVLPWPLFPVPPAGAFQFPQITFPQPIVIPAIRLPTFPPITTSPAATIVNAPNPYTFAAPTVGGSQFQAGSVQPGASNAQSAISGTGGLLLGSQQGLPAAAFCGPVFAAAG